MQQQEPPQRHLECPEGFVFIGNMTRSAFKRLDWTKKQEGQMCFGPDKMLIPQGGVIPEQRLVPVFVNRNEFEARQGTPVFFPA